MSNKHADFWYALLNHSQDQKRRARLWNGYLGWKLPSKTKGEIDSKGSWPQLTVDPPDGGWPKLNEEERRTIEELAERHGGHPEFEFKYIDFSGRIIPGDTDFSGLILVRSDFSGTTFQGPVTLSHDTWFYDHTWFLNATFEEGLHCTGTWFDSLLSFADSCFKDVAHFMDAKFMGGASFTRVLFKGNAIFNNSRFEERCWPSIMAIPELADFRNAKFMARTSFRRVIFGNDRTANSRRVWPERSADFSDAEFMTTTEFQGAVFGAVPAFFNATLHEDTDFGLVDWEKAETETIGVDYAIRAWERLELMMSKLEKPLERHRFFRLKMRAKRRSEGFLLRGLNWLFEKTADYGWGVGRAFSWWFGHWAIFAVVLFANTCPTCTRLGYWAVALAALGTSFANAHAFFGLATAGGYLEDSRQLLEQNNEWGLLAGVGVAEVVLGPAFLFLLLLTLRNRFRLA